MTHFDVAIIGGGIMGSSTAYHLRKQGFAGSIAVFEKDPTYKHACTALSWGGIRRQFSTPENIKLSTFGLDFIENLSVFGDDTDISFKSQGYLVLASEAGIPILEENAALQRSMGADTILLRTHELEERFPHMLFHGISMGSLGQSREGWFDPYRLLSIVRKGAISRGATYIAQDVIRLRRPGSHFALATANGEEFTATHVVNAAGTNGGHIASLIGIDLPVSAAKRYVYVVDCPSASDAMRKGPLTFDTNGFYFRPEGRNFIWGYTPTEEEEPQIKDWEMDFPLFEEKLWPMAAERVPAFEAVKLVGSWVGHYDYNWFDQNGIIGRHPDLPNFYFANGFSGHGIQQGPAVGNAIAELIHHGQYRTMDLTAMGYERLQRKEPLFEKNIF
jgi:FAD-dependent oxidoreductase domain-containing protein 1